MTSEPLKIGWKVSALAANIASVRYRALLPMIALESPEVRCRLFASGDPSELDGLDVLVIVKSFTADDLRLAQLGAARGIRVVFDLCDNVFIGEYGVGKGLTPANSFLNLVPYLSCIVTTTPPLAAEVRKHVGSVPVVEIPDGIDSPAFAGRMAKIVQVAQAREGTQTARRIRERIFNVARRVRDEGMQIIPALVGYAARRASRTLARGVRVGLKRGRRAAAALPARVAARPARLQPQPQAQVQGADAPRYIVWFGNHGAEHARFGMLDILEFREAIESIAAEQDVELIVISNHRAKYKEHILPLAIKSHYVEWDPRQVEKWLARASIVIVPNTLDDFSICKSANRTVHAMRHGAPVVATMTPALEPLAGHIHTGDPLAAFRQVLAQPEAAREQAHQGYQVAESLFGTDALRRQWLQLLETLPAADSAAAAEPYLAVVLHLVQDLDLALPILREARAAGLPAAAWCSPALLKKSPRVLPALKQEGMPFQILPDEKYLSQFTFPSAMRVLLTVAETNLNPHRVPRSLSKSAVRNGLLVATLQHGFENVGLTYDDEVHAIDQVTMAAQRIYTWGPLDTLHPRAPMSLRVRCMPVGCPKETQVPPANLDGLLPRPAPVVGIFENLHWHRYSEEYRQDFIDSVRALASAFPDVVFLLKPHHAGMWMTARYQGDRPQADNLVIADPQAPEWENHTAGALLAHMSSVITTPSTVALDAARIGLPVAVVAGDLEIENYRPLTLLNGTASWVEFVRRSLEQEARTPLQERSEHFVGRVLLPGNAARRIVEDLRMTVGR